MFFPDWHRTITVLDFMSSARKFVDRCILGKHWLWMMTVGSLYRLGLKYWWSKFRNLNCLWVSGNQLSNTSGIGSILETYGLLGNQTFIGFFRSWTNCDMHTCGHQYLF